MYYLQSRYYDPEIGRFLNADAFASTGQGLLGNNMFSYCRNNPVSRIDVSGTADSIAYNDGELLSNDELDSRSGGGAGSIYNESFKSYQNATSNVSNVRNFRKGLAKVTGTTPSGCDAHHIFPNAFTSEFERLGIDNQNPYYGSWVDSRNHRSFSYEYNLWWREFFRTPGVKASDAFALVEFLAGLFGFDIFK